MASRLTARDYRGMLDLVELAGTDESGRAFDEAFVDALWRLVPCDVVAYREWTEARGHYERSIVGEDVDERWTVWRHYNDVRHDDPLPGGAGVPKPEIVGRPLALDDVVSTRRFRRSAVYEEQCKPLGVRDVLKLFLPPAGSVCSAFVFDTSAPAFTGHDRLVLRRLVPLFVQIQRNARLRANVMRASARLEGLTVREREVLGRAAAGETNEQIAAALFIGPSTVRKHLEHVLEKLEVRNRAAATALYALSRADEPDAD